MYFCCIDDFSFANGDGVKRLAQEVIARLTHVFSFVCVDRCSTYMKNPKVVIRVVTDLLSLRDLCESKTETSANPPMKGL